ncbi:MAG: hypothetical protein HYT29_00550, partial [Parcubacteria group bacterium]|nr:hypothetical protein [Parcubacteria group bacterium]
QALCLRDIFVAFLISIAFIVVPAAEARGEEGRGPPPASPLFETKAILENDFNLLHTGRSRIFPPLTSPIDEGIEETEKDLWLQNRNSIHMFFTGHYAHVWLRTYTLHRHLIHAPEAVGLESTVLFPVHFISSRLLVGLYHDSAHNQDTSRYGDRGSDFTGVQVKFVINESPSFASSVWLTQNGLQNKKTPYYVTAEAKGFTQNELGEMANEFGGDISWKLSGGISSKVAVRLRTSTADPLSPASFRIDTQSAFEVAPNLSIGIFSEYRQNFRFEEELGHAELLAGPRITWGF